MVVFCETVFAEVFEVSTANIFYVRLPVSGRVFTGTKIFSTIGLASKKVYKNSNCTYSEQVHINSLVYSIDSLTCQ